MNRESAMRTSKGMSLPNTRKTTSRTVLRCIPGINLSDGSLSLDLVAGHSQLPRPEGRGLPLRKKSRGVRVADSSC